MSHTPIPVRPDETKALGDYAIRRNNRADEVKTKFYQHMLEKRRQLFSFNPFMNRTRTSKTPKSKPAAKSEAIIQKNLNKLRQVSKESQEVVYSASSVFPFALFPDTITFDRHKLSIVYRTFFWVEQTVSVPLADIKNIQAEMGPFFGTLIVTSDTFINNTQTVNYLRRKDVKCIQELVQGAMMAKKEEIDISKVPPQKLFKLLTDLGRGHSGATA